MKEMTKRTAVLALAGVMAAGMLSGCGEKKLDGAETVATVNQTAVPMGVFSLMVRQNQAQTNALYAQFMGTDYAIWDTEAEDGKTYGQQMAEQGLEQLELMYLMKEKAADYQVEVTEEDQKAIAEAAAAFMEANSQETLEKLSVTEEQVKTYLELKTYEARMYEPIVADVDTEIPDEEAQQSSFEYVSINTADLEEDEIKTKKEDAQKILDALKEDPEADFDEAAKAVSEDYSALEGTFDTNEAEEEEEETTTYSSSYPEEVLEVLRTLKDGETGSDVIETDTGFYVVRMKEVKDQEATDDKKESILQERKNQLYTEVTEGWLEDAEITVNDKVLETLTVTDNDKYTIVILETETSEEESAGETEAQEEETGDAEETAAEEENSEEDTLEPVVQEEE